MKNRIYLLPGLMCDKRLWSDLKVYLEDKYELIPLDIPFASNLDEMCESLINILPEEKINLLGFSLGGYISSYLTSKYPERINKLLVMSATGCDLPKEEIEKRFNMINLSHNFALKDLSRQKILTLLDKKHHDNERVITLIQQMYKELGVDVFKQQIQATLYRKDVLLSLQELSLPILFLYAMGDRLVNKEWLKQLENVSHIKQTALSNDSHMLPLEEPKLVTTHIKNFFK